MSTVNSVQIANPYLEGIVLEVGFENANPSSAEFVAASPDGIYHIRQRVEPNAPAGVLFCPARSGDQQR